MRTSLVALHLFVSLCLLSACGKSHYNLSDYGLLPDTGENASPLLTKAIEAIYNDADTSHTIFITLPHGRYDFYPEGAMAHTYYISNHDQDNPKLIGLSLENKKNIFFNGKGSELVFHGRMLPVSLVNTTNCTLMNFHIDFDNPHISQVTVLENDTAAGQILYEVAPWVNYEIRDSTFVAKGEGWEHISRSGIAFEGETKRLVYRTSDIRVGTRGVVKESPRHIRAPWKNSQLIPGTVVALRGHGRPTPGVFLYHADQTRLLNINVHYAEGMGLLAQMCEDIQLDGFSVCLRGDADPRYFTTQADATHFSGCRGKIVSQNGIYEGMMDDAINVHGTYLKVTGREGDRTLIANYMHDQSYGFDWGFPGDTVQFINASTMEIYGSQNNIERIEPVDQPTVDGAKIFRITFTHSLDTAINTTNTFGIENLTWTPEVCFANNIVRNNRARGTLFSTPRRTVIENNVFDHTSGTAILLCGDCNGWFETGACKDVVIRNNRFINSLTNMFQFTNAIISIYPVIPDLEHQQAYFHSNIVIEENLFDTFDTPIVYAKSVNGLVFRNNVIRHNTEYPAFHWNTQPFLFERVTNEVLEHNTLE